MIWQSGIKCVQLNGAMNITEKGRAIDTFTHDADYKVFLMSLKAGGVALNLTVASHVFLMDNWWNPAVENQAQDRIHRIGQFKPIKSTRFVIKDTVEERILQLQQKQLVFEGTVGDSLDAMSKLTEADLKFLFQI
ncbi:Helicase protein with RING/U-box domain [Zea mays]|uniref:Helicase protein with RING/U-box domain n=1 Tax=Zea mays TaxID=4577 RepID=A0A1D6Q0R7_MAIZE|nr:Helicase protein with RING/U-box domain [Zea mays]